MDFGLRKIIPFIKKEDTNNLVCEEVGEENCEEACNEVNYVTDSNDATGNEAEVNSEDLEFTLEECPLEQEFVIKSVPDNSLLESLGFRPGKKVQIKAKECFKGPMICCVEGRNVALCRKIASKITLGNREKPCNIEQDSPRRGGYRCRNQKEARIRYKGGKD